MGELPRFPPQESDIIRKKELQAKYALLKGAAGSQTMDAQVDSTATLVGGNPRGSDANAAQQIGANVILVDRRLGSLEASDDLSVVQECFVGAFLLLLMFPVYLFTRR